jgi:hypothetical protein
MPIDFLTEEQKQNYRRYAAEPNEVQLSRYFILDENDRTFIAQRRGDQNRLGIALQLTSVRFLGVFLSDLTLVLHSVQAFIGMQLSINWTAILADYAKREPTRWEHYVRVKKYYHYHESGEFPWTCRLNRLLYTRAWISNVRPSLMFDFATSWLLQHEILLPGATTLTRVIAKICERAANWLWQGLLVLLNDEQKHQLGELVSFSECQRESMFERLRAICHGQRGEIRRRYREGQEDKLGSLGLVTNAIVLWNTLYMQETLGHINTDSQPTEINEVDISRLSSLMHGHINMLGHYSFTLSEHMMKGELRPLKHQVSEYIYA